MKIIEKLSNHIEEEIKDAICYAKMALEYKQEYPRLADALYNLSLNESEHMSILHDHVVDIIEKYRKEHGEPPAAMLAVYEYLHNKHIENAKDAKTYQSMYKDR